jgi:hypothetical protein
LKEVGDDDHPKHDKAYKLNYSLRKLQVEGMVSKADSGKLVVKVQLKE